MSSMVRLFIIFVTSSLILQAATNASNYSIPNNSVLHQMLYNLSTEFSHLTQLKSIGKSVKGQDLWLLTINRNSSRRIPLQPHVRLTANIHGNEVPGRLMLVELARFLLSNYGTHDHVTWLVNSTTIHLLPSMNPDGFDISIPGRCYDVYGRYNNNSVDLNRNFFKHEFSKPLQPETKATIEWINNETHALAGNIHGGILAIVYPWNINKSEPSPDDDVYRYISTNYSRSHPSMHKGHVTCRNVSVKKDGVFQGGLHMWRLFGTLADYTYMYGSGYEIGIEVSCCKYPPYSYIDHQIWLDNKQSLLNFIGQVHMGVKGLVFLKRNKSLPLPDAAVVIVGREDVIFKTNKHGEYWKLLLPGIYTVKVWWKEYKTKVTFMVQKEAVTRLDIILSGANAMTFTFIIFYFAVLIMLIFA